MANAKHLAHLRDGWEVWNQWRQDNPKALPDLSQVDFREADLHMANLRGANLSRADLHLANLSGRLIVLNFNSTYLRTPKLQRYEQNNPERLRKWDSSEAERPRRGGITLPIAPITRSGDLRGADLSEADLSEAYLGHGDLRGANLRGANLSGADLRGADFRRADLSNAHFYQTVFGGTNLKDARGLSTCNHGGPSFVDHLTLAKSGRLPLTFLRGCGFPDAYIDYLPSLLGGGVQFYSCFISYSTEDQPFAERLHADLQSKGVRCWFAPHRIQGGQKIHEQIDEAVRLYERLLLIVSANSMKSRWVKTEIAFARRKALLEGRQVLFPILRIPAM